MTGTSERQRVLAVVGPTAAGKSALACRLAARFGGEIVSADSMQVYRGMDIGTAKTPEAERCVPHHCLDLADPGEPFSAALFQEAARHAIRVIAERGGLPVVCGGTGLYVRAALDDMRFPSGELTSPTRERLEALAAEIGAEALHARLEAADPASAALIHPRNVKRVVRALEMAEEGVSYAEQARRFRERKDLYDTLYLGLSVERAVLYERIDARVDAMIAGGLPGEVRRLLAEGYRDALTAAQAIGYKELVPVVESGASLDEAVSAIKQATRRYAKRQMSWFRADPRVRWLDVTGLTAAEAEDQAALLVGSWETSSRAEV